MGRKQKRQQKDDSDTNESTQSIYSGEPVEDRSWFVDLSTSFVSTMVLFGIYMTTLYPSVPGGDSGELIVSAHEWGVAHPPGYPLFTLTAKLAMLWIPWGNPAWRVNALNAYYSALAGGFLQLTVLRLTGCQGSGLLAAALFSLSKLTWTWSASAEVFGLNNLLVASIMLVSVMFEMAKEVPKIRKVTYLGSFLCGLALSNQHTSVIYVACIALWVLLRLQKYQILTPSMMMKIGVCFLLGLLPYIYLPLSSCLAQPQWTWGDQSSISGFLTHLLRSEYGTFDLGKGSSGLGFTHGLRSYLEHTYLNLCYFGPLLALAGTIVAANRKEKGEGCLFVFIIMLALYASFFAWRANLDISDQLMRGVVERFWMQSDLVLVVFSAIGYQAILRWFTTKIFGKEKSSLSIVFACIGAVSVVALQFRNRSDCDYSSNTVVRDFANTLLNNMPEKAVVFTKGDLPTNSMRYLHLCEEVRPDLTLIDVEVMSYEWSAKVREHHKRIYFPGDFWHLTNRMHDDGRQSFNFKTLLDKNYKKAPMFVCIGMQNKDPSWQEGYTLLPYGVCHKIDKGGGFNPEEWANKTGNYSDNWPYKWDSFPATSWEKVANDEMWHAKISSAFFMYDQSEKITDDDAKVRLLMASYDLYFNAIKRNQRPSKMHHQEGFPSFWHKNFALVLERLLHVESPIDKARLCKQSISHFQQYVASNPDDKDISKIVEAIDNLRERLPTYEKWDTSFKKVEEITKKYTGET